MPTTTDRRNRQKSRYSFPMDATPSLYRPPLPGQPMPLIPAPGADPENYELGRRTNQFRDNTAALLGGLRPPMPGPVGMEQFGTPTGSHYDNLGFQQQLTARMAPAPGWGQWGGPQSADNIARGYDTMAALGITPGSQKLAAIAGGSPGDQRLLALRQQFPMMPGEDQASYAQRVQQAYGLNPETGMAARTFVDTRYMRPPAGSDEEAQMLARREASQKARKEKEQARRDNRLWNAMAATPAGRRKIAQQQLEQAAQEAQKERMADIVTAYASNPAADPTVLREALASLTAGPNSPFASSTASLMEQATQKWPKRTLRDRQAAVQYVVSNGGDPSEAESLADQYYSTRPIVEGIKQGFGMVGDVLGMSAVPVTQSEGVSKPSSRTQPTSILPTEEARNAIAELESSLKKTSKAVGQKAFVNYLLPWVANKAMTPKKK